MLWAVYSRAMWLQVETSGLGFSYLINSLQRYSCCHCLSGSTVSTEQLWVFSSDLLTASCLQDGRHSSKHHTYVIWRLRKNRAKLLGLSFLKIKAKALLEVLEQIPAHIAVAGSRLNNDPSVEETGKWLTIQLLSWEAGRERSLQWLLSSRSTAPHTMHCSRSQDSLLPT